MNKIFGKIKESGFSILYNVAMLGNAFLFSYLVINYLSKTTWNIYTKINLITALLLQVAYFGNREYLLIKYAKQPSEIKNIFSENFSSRFAILIIALPFVFLNAFSSQTLLLIAAIVCVRFIYQSFDSLIVYNKKFKQGFFVEIVISLVFLFCFLFFKFPIDLIDTLFTILLLAELVKLILYILLFGIPEFVKPKLEELKNSVPFFLIGLSGFAASKIDVYITGLTLSEETLGTYQILSNFLLLIQASSNYIFAPFSKFVARVKFDTVRKLSLRLFLVGLFLCPVAIFAIKYTVSKFYQIEISSTTIILGLICSLPVYAFLPYAYYLMRMGKAQALVFTNLFAAIFSSLLILLLRIFIPIEEINVPVLIMLIAQVMTMMLIFSYANKLSHEK